jgi:uncharacterized protein
MDHRNIDLSSDRISDFCQRWKVSQFALFGSALHGSFRPESDVDVLVTFTPDAVWSLFDHVRMTQELESLLGRRVDLVNRRAIERSRNLIRRQAILDSAELIYVAG